MVNGPLEDFVSGIEKYGMGQTLQTESCAGKNSASTFGIIADMSSGTEALLRVRNALKAWSKGRCANTSQEAYSTAPIVTALVRVCLSGSFSNGSSQAGNWTGVTELKEHKANSTRNANPVEAQKNE